MIVPPGPLGPVRVVQYFSTNVALTPRGTPVYVTFKPNEIVNYEPLVRRLLELGCPVMPVDDTTTTICPKCRSLASWKTNAKEVTLVKANAGFSFNDQFFSFQIGDILAYPWLIDQAKKNRIPMETASGIECPHCKFVWY